MSEANTVTISLEDYNELKEKEKLYTENNTIQVFNRDSYGYKNSEYKGKDVFIKEMMSDLGSYLEKINNLEKELKKNKFNYYESIDKSFKSRIRFLFTKKLTI